MNYARADTWGGEHFAFAYEKVFMFTAADNSAFPEQEQAIRARKPYTKPARYMLTFTLMNTSRNCSTDLIASLYSRNGKYYLHDLDFSNSHVLSKAKNTPKGVSLHEPKIGQGISLTYEGAAHEPEWIFGNTVDNKTFNLSGFHDPRGGNITIAGGAPEAFNDVLDKCDQGYMLAQKNMQTADYPGGYQSRNADQGAPVHVGNTSWAVNI